MSTDSKRSVKVVFWVGLLSLIFGFYFLLPKIDQSHNLELVPEDAEFVAVLDNISVARTFKKYIEENPMAFGDFMSNKYGENALLKYGINPMQKIVSFSLKDHSTNDRTYILLVEVAKPSYLVHSILGRKPANDITKKEVWSEFDADGRIVVGGLGKIALVMYLPNEVGSKESIDQFISKILKDDKKLVAVNADFKKMITQKEHFSFWVSGAYQTSINVSTHLSVFQSLFENVVISSTLQNEGVIFKGTLFESETKGLLPRENEALELQGKECFRLSASVNPHKFTNILEAFIPSNKKYLLSSWNGGVCVAVDRFEPVELKKKRVKIDTAGVEETYFVDLIETKIEVENVGFRLNELMSYPAFTIACEIDDVDAVKKLMKSDSSIKEKNGIYSFAIDSAYVQFEKNGITVTEKQHIYFYFDKNSLVISPDYKQTNFNPVYTTFGCVFDMPALVACYTPRSFMDDFGMTIIEGFGIKGVSFNAVSVTDETVGIEGKFSLVDTTESHLIAIPRMLKKIPGVPF